MGWLRAGLIGAVLPVALWVPVSAAGGNSADASATKAYLIARYAELRAEAAHPLAEVHALEALTKKLTGECPGVLANAPKPADGKLTPPEREMLDEETSVIFDTAEHAEYPERERFAQTVSRLRWSSRPLTELVHGDARETAAQAGVHLPNLCADLRAWVASDYKVVPATAKRYLYRLQVISQMTVIIPEPGEPDTFEVSQIIARRLKRYEDNKDKAIIRRTQHIGHSEPISRIKKFLEVLGKALRSVSEALRTPPAN